jgi:IS5 family transposase
VIWSGVFVMSLWPREDRGVPERTSELARAVMPDGCFAMRWRDVLGVVFEDAAFAGLFASRGRPAASPTRLAIISVLQFVEGLTDRQAADAVRLRVDWKYLLGLELEDEGFDASVLCEFRARLAETGTAEALIFERILEILAQSDLVANGGRARTDSTAVIAQVRNLERLELVGETLRAALEAVAAIEPAWLRQAADPEWFTRYGPRVDAYRLPKNEAERQALAVRIGADGIALFTRSRLPGAPQILRVLPALEALRAIWLQQYYQDDSGILWRERSTHGRPPGAASIVSPYDLDARYTTKRGHAWNGYKAQLSECCDDLLPHIITYVDTVPATEADIYTTARVHTALSRRGLLPAEHLADSAYISADQVLCSRETYGLDLIGPATSGHHWQSGDAEAFDIDAFTIDWEGEKVICPTGAESNWWRVAPNKTGHPVVQITFSQKDCTPCPVRSRCTRAKTSARTITLRPRVEHELLHELREREQTDEWKTLYARRSGVEGTISQAVRAFDLRRCRYRGLLKTRVQTILVATAVNLTRLDAWLCGTPLGRTRVSHLAALAPAP